MLIDSLMMRTQVQILRIVRREKKSGIRDAKKKKLGNSNILKPKIKLSFKKKSFTDAGTELGFKLRGSQT